MSDLLEPPRPNHTIDGKPPRKTAWQVQIPKKAPGLSGFYNRGYKIPDLFTTRQDALRYIEQNGDIKTAVPVEVAVSVSTATALAADDT